MDELSCTAAQTRKSPARRIGTPIPDSGRIGNRGFPVSRFRPSRETIPPESPDFPKKPGNRGIGNPISQVTSFNCSGLGTYSAASIMPVLSQAVCGSYSGSETVRGNMLL